MRTEQLQSLAYGVVRGVGAVIFLYLTYYSLRYSQYMFPQVQREFPVDVKGLPVQCILAAGGLGVLVFGLSWLKNRGAGQILLWMDRVFLAISLLWMGGFSFWWIRALDRQPVGDQAFVYGGASYFMEGLYVFLEKGAYCGTHPYQLGLIACVEALFIVFGAYNYYAYQMMCAIMAVDITFMGYCLLKELRVPFGAGILYSALMMGCIPLICYTSWVYGDVPSIFFTMLAAWLALRWENARKKRYLMGIVASCVMAMLVRRTSMILLIALCILASLHVIRYRRWQIVATALLAAVCSYLAYQGIYRMYEVRSGIEHQDGIPTNSWILMGMLQQEDRCGWYNNIELQVFYAVNNDREKAKEIMDGYIEERLKTFKADPAYARWFLKQKILSQWNDPLYQSIYFSAQDLERHSPKQGSFLEKLYFVPEVHDQIFRFADVVQFLIYLGTLFYFLFGIRRDTRPLACLLAVIIIGGFFLSVIWEAKARYIFPYYVMMYPLAAEGYFAAAGRAAEIWGKAVSVRGRGKT